MESPERSFSFWFRIIKSFDFEASSSRVDEIEMKIEMGKLLGHVRWKGFRECQDFIVLIDNYNYFM